MNSDHSRWTVRWCALALVVLCLVFLGCLLPVRRLGIAVYRPFAACWNGICRLTGDVYSRVFPSSRRAQESLARQLQEAQVRLAAVEKLEMENRQLRQAAGLPVPVGWRALSAEVVGRDPLSWQHEFLLNRGKSHGVKPGVPVLFHGEVIGRVVEVFQNTCRVALLGSGQCQMAVYVQHGTERYFGLLQGTTNGGPQPLVRYLKKEARISDGDPVFLSGLGGQLPYGLPVGKASVAGLGPELIDHSYAAISVRSSLPRNEIYAVILLVSP